MNEIKWTIIRNIVYIIILQMVCFPLGVLLWIFLGHWHLAHLFLIFGYFYAIVLIVETANLLIKHVRLVDKDKEKVIKINDK